VLLRFWPLRQLRLSWTKVPSRCATRVRGAPAEHRRSGSSARLNISFFSWIVRSPCLEARVRERETPAVLSAPVPCTLVRGQRLSLHSAQSRHRCSAEISERDPPSHAAAAEALRDVSSSSQRRSLAVPQNVISELHIHSGFTGRWLKRCWLEKNILSLSAFWT